MNRRAEKKEEKLTISQWAAEDRPREKMMKHGAAALSNAELLAILIGSGNTEDSAVALMRKVLDSYSNSLSRLGKCSVEELCQFTIRKTKGQCRQKRSVSEKNRWEAETKRIIGTKKHRNTELNPMLFAYRILFKRRLNNRKEVKKLIDSQLCIQCCSNPAEYIDRHVVFTFFDLGYILEIDSTKIPQFL